VKWVDVLYELALKDNRDDISLRKHVRFDTQQALCVDKVGAGRCNFLRCSCKFSTENIIQWSAF